MMDDTLTNTGMEFDEPMDRFITHYVNSFVKWDIVNYCHEHSGEPFKIQDLARALNRPLDQIKKDVTELVEASFLNKKTSGKLVVYQCQLEPSNSTADLINRFSALCRTREGRLRVIYKILKDGKPISHPEA
jgi:hypothetical protein